jgi:hypothetical protein
MVLGVAAPNAMAAPSITAPSAPPQGTDCDTYAQGKYMAADWVCVGDTLTVVDKSSGKRRVEQLKKSSATPGDGVVGALATSRQRARTEEIIASIDGNRYVIPFTHDITLLPKDMGGGARVTESFRVTTGGSVGLTFSLRVRRNDTLGRDSTIFTYSGVQGSSTPTSSWSEYFSPIEGPVPVTTANNATVFWDAYSIQLRAGGTSLNVAGSVQSARATCNDSSCVFNF